MKKAQRVIFKNPILWAFFIISFRFFPVFANPSEPSITIDNKENIENKNEGSVVFTDQWLCRKSGEVRTLRVEKKLSECTALYNKAGINQKMLNSKNPDNCSPIVLKIKGNLESAGWKCKDISDSLITE